MWCVPCPTRDNVASEIFRATTCMKYQEKNRERTWISISKDKKTQVGQTNGNQFYTFHSIPTRLTSISSLAPSAWALTALSKPSDDTLRAFAVASSCAFISGTIPLFSLKNIIITTRSSCVSHALAQLAHANRECREVSLGLTNGSAYTSTLLWCESPRKHVVEAIA